MATEKATLYLLWVPPEPRLFLLCVLVHAPPSSQPGCGGSLHHPRPDTQRRKEVGSVAARVSATVARANRVSRDMGWLGLWITIRQPAG
jgi:hypothetical protein